jgi:adenylyltransferase/sulfurtransferase
VDLSNLHRQILYTEQDVGRKKTTAAKEKLQQLNPALKINLIEHRMTDDELVEHCGRVDVVLDCSDNFVTRHAVNKACVKNAKPLVSGAAIRFEGQIGTFNLGKQSPCYACLYPEGDDEAQRCSEAGVLGPLVGVIGSMQAMETIKLLVTCGENLDGRLLIFDAHNMQWRSIKLQKDAQCPVCSSMN